MECDCSRFYNALDYDCSGIVRKILKEDDWLKNKYREINVKLEKKVISQENDLLDVITVIEVSLSETNKEIEIFKVFEYGDGGMCSDIATKRRRIEKQYVLLLAQMVKNSIELNLCYEGITDCEYNINVINKLDSVLDTPNI